MEVEAANEPNRKRGRPRKKVSTDTKAYFRAYYAAHKEKYNKPVYCQVCGKTVVHIKAHQNTKIHKRNSEITS